MNVITVAQIKRSGFAALDAALAHGPVHVMKRNRPSAVLLSTADYEDLLLKVKRNQAPASHGLSQFLAQDVRRRWPGRGGPESSLGWIER
jgi:PHD/YefM family antitoxin component YafN of YafNO toxin-antitoxin module